MTVFNTADLCDDHQDIQIAEPIFKSYGKKKKFFGKIRTVDVIDDNSYVKKLVNEKVKGDVMVIDGKGSTKCALIGDNLARIASENGWSGFVINGCIRDSEIISTIEVGIKAINVVPNKSDKKDVGEYKKELSFANITFKEGEYLYSDSDGVLTSKELILNDIIASEDSLIPYRLASCIKIFK